MLISSITARGLTLTTSCMNVPLSSENGPNDIACVQPMTSVKNAVAAFTSGTVMPVWSWPRRPGICSAEADCGEPAKVNVTMAVRNTPDLIMMVSLFSNFAIDGASASVRRCQLTLDAFRILGETFG